MRTLSVSRSSFTLLNAFTNCVYTQTSILDNPILWRTRLWKASIMPRFFRAPFSLTKSRFECTSSLAVTNFSCLALTIVSCILWKLRSSSVTCVSQSSRRDASTVVYVTCNLRFVSRSRSVRRIVSSRSPRTETECVPSGCFVLIRVLWHAVAVRQTSKSGQNTLYVYPFLKYRMSN